ncbi:MAG: ADP-ribosylation factor-like protein [Promethearchaeati archaeon SRVP18_Atabeyarchaeia-1]
MSNTDKKLMSRVTKIAGQLEALVDSLIDALRKLGTELKEIQSGIEGLGVAGSEAGVSTGPSDFRRVASDAASAGSSGSSSGSDVISVKSIAADDKSLEEIGDRVLKRQVDVIEAPSGKSSSAGEEETQIIKLTLAGYGAVGKTTIFKLLKGVAAPAAYFPTIGANVDREDILIRNARIRVWDLAGQEQYHRTWPIFLRNSKLVLLVTDSSRTNVERSKNLMNLVKTIEPKATLIGIANKQDLPNRLSPQEIESILGVKSYGLVAIDTAYREKIIDVVARGIAEIIAKES